jgi:uncharacterized protein YjbI with pentapeptide repeats
MITRRAIVTSALLGVVPTKPIATGHRRRITQGELDNAIDQHGRWLDRRDSGRRANFSSCDLSGLDFGWSDPRQVVLRGADFTEADLQGVRANDVNFHYASFQYANLSFSHLKAPVFSCANLSEANCHDAVWGWPKLDPAQPIARVVHPSEHAVFIGARLTGVCFDQARVRGYFNDCSLVGASLAFADFSQSQFAGKDGVNRFAHAKLLQTKFHFASISSALFNRAVIQDADFFGAELHPRIATLLRKGSAMNVAG